jgi:hypothetical protein
MNRFKNKYWVRLILVTVLLCMGISMVGCHSHKLKRMYTFPYYEATIDNLPPVDEIRGVLVSGPAPLYKNTDLCLIGNRSELERLLGHKLWAESILDEREVLERLVMYFKNAERNDEIRDIRFDIAFAFITDKRAYVIRTDEQGAAFVGPDWQSTRIGELLNGIEYRAQESKRKELEAKPAEPGSDWTAPPDWPTLR